jgi:CTP synthase (UTP-ammonia lyase)
VGFARRARRPFLGTCAGFQHAVLEYAQSFWSIAHAAHQELEPAAPDPVISLLACRLVEVEGRIRLEPGSRLARLYGCDETTEGYHCNYGLNPRWAPRLEAGPLRVAARDPAGEVRAVELAQHPFFIATLYQPERSALRNLDHPLIAAFVTAAADGVTS